jgi:tetratricopeptide (TPR) repeat protein
VRTYRFMRLLLSCCAVGLISCNTPLPSDTLPDPSDPAPAPAPAPAPPDPGGALAITDIPGTVIASSATIATDQEPPFQLTTSDGAGLLLTKIEAKAVVDGPLAFTELHLYFHNPEQRVREGRFAVTLPDEAALSRFAMENGGQWMEAEVVPKMIARRAYEDFLHRRQDPALLEKADGNEFTARVFPIPAGGDKHLVLSYSQELREDQYSLPLRGLATVGAVNASVRVVDDKGVARTATLSQKQWKPDRDFTVAAPAHVAVSAGGLVVARATVELPSAADAVTDATILVDSSASRALGYRDQVKAVRAMIAALAATRPELTVEVAAFDQETVSLYNGKASGFGDAQERALASREPLGASDLGQALAWAKGKHRRVIVVSDGMITAGADAAALPALVHDLKAERLDLVLAGGLRDAQLAAQLATAGLPRAGAVLDLARGPAEVARRLSLATQTQVPVVVPGATWSWPTSLAAAQPGDRVIVYAKLAKPGPVELRIGAARVQLTARTANGALLQRAGARAVISELEAKIAAEAKPEVRTKLRAELSQLSVKHRVLSSETAMLVLESESDYDRYGIPRNALADILVVGPSGIELTQRKGPVLMAEPVIKQVKAPKLYKRKMKDEAPSDPRAPGGRAEDMDAPKIESEASLGASDGDDKSVEEAGEAEAEKSDCAPQESSRPMPSSAPRPAAPMAEPPPPPPPPPPASVRAGNTGGGSGNAVAMDERRASRRPPPDRDSDGVLDSSGASSETPRGPDPLTGDLAEIMKSLQGKRTADALAKAWAWRHRDYGDVLALIGLGEALEARGDRAQAARAYGSIIDLFPARADLRRFAGQRLERLGASARALVLDTYRRAVADRPDHLTGYRLLAYALVRDGKLAEAFDTVEKGLRQEYPGDRFAGGDQILREDAGLIAAAWIAKDAKIRGALTPRLTALGAQLATTPSTRFVLYWETDANDVDFHIRDARGGHAYYQAMQLPSGGQLYRDVTTGYGPECFTIPGTPKAGPYRLSINYYSQGPMGYGMGLLEVLVHDGKGGLTFDERPYVVMQPGAFVELGSIGTRSPSAVIAK